MVDVLDRLRLDVPVAQAGMGGGIAGATLAAAVANAGGLGTLGLVTARQLRTAIDQVRAGAPGRAVAVNLLLPFLHRGHVDVCVRAGVDVVVLAFGEKQGLIAHLRDAGIVVFVMVGTRNQALRAVGGGADGLIAQGREAGGHLVGTMPALDFLPQALAVAGPRPVFLAGGIADRADTSAALAAGASGVIAGTRFLMTRAANANRAYQRRIISAEQDGGDEPVRLQLAAATPRPTQRRHPAMVPRRWDGQGGAGGIQRRERPAFGTGVLRGRSPAAVAVAGPSAVHTAAAGRGDARILGGAGGTVCR
nr:nitronate monooxygenase [Mycobacterium kansasii]